MIRPTSKITIPYGINQTQMDWLRLLTSSSSSKVASLKITSIPSRPMIRVLYCSQNLKLLGKSNDTNLGEVASFKITSIPSMQPSNSLIFILSNIKISIFITMVLSELSRFLKYDYPTLYRVPSQFPFTRKENHPALAPKNFVPTSPCQQQHTFRFSV